MSMKWISGNLLRQHTQMNKLFKGMGSGLTGGMKAQQRIMSQMQGKQRF
jgi:signal recognition particle subunit SRP54